MSLQQAIERSQSHNERVSVTFQGSRESLLVELDQLIDSDSDLEIDSADENDGSVDVWCFDPHQPNGEMTWRLCVTFEPAKLSDR